MKLIKQFEKSLNHQLQVIELTCEASSRDDIGDIPYDEFKANLFINGRFIADIKPVLDEAGVFTEMVDSVDWRELYMEEKEDLKHAV